MDKRGAAVIVDVSNYINKANQELNNARFYKTSPANTYLIKINETIDKLKMIHLLDEKSPKNLKCCEAKTPLSKLFPKNS